MRTDHQESIQAENATNRVIEIELLALDLTSCTRCVGTLRNIERALGIVRPVVEATGARVDVRTLVIESEEQACQYGLVASPTVRIDGKDIVFDTIESRCDSCTDLCGCDEGTSCRIWTYQGSEYTEAPVGLVVEALLRGLADNTGAAVGPLALGEVPENLRRFFASAAARRQPQGGPCCPSSEQENCCTPDQKSGCCDPAAPATCGCR